MDMKGYSLMRNNYPNIVVAYHGCDETVRDDVIRGALLKQSENPYDWLLRNLDCAVIETLHQYVRTEGSRPTILSEVSLRKGRESIPAPAFAKRLTYRYA